MEELEQIILKRIQIMDLNSLCNTVDKLKVYGLNFYNNNGEFIFEKFRSDCIKTCDLLFKKDKPHPNTGIKYELSDFMSAVQTIVGIRNITEFMQYQD